MPDMGTPQDEYAKGQADERARVQAILDTWRDALGRLYIPLSNRVANPDYDPRKLDHDEDRLHD